MKFVCGVLSFLWFCNTPVSSEINKDFEKELQFIINISLLLEVPLNICPKLGEYNIEAMAESKLFYDQHMQTIQNMKSLSLESFVNRAKTCKEKCECSSLAAILENIEVAIPKEDKRLLLENAESMQTADYLKCQKKLKLNCESKPFSEFESI